MPNFWGFNSVPLVKLIKQKIEQRIEENVGDRFCVGLALMPLQHRPTQTLMLGYLGLLGQAIASILNLHAKILSWQDGTS